MERMIDLGPSSFEAGIVHAGFGELTTAAHSLANISGTSGYYSKAQNLGAMSDGAIDVVVDYVLRLQGAFTAAYFEPLGGAVGRVDVLNTPYAGREAAYGFHCLAGWIEPSEDEAVIGWASSFHAAMGAHATGGVYVNLIADDESDRVPNAYRPNYDRLARLKREWDPDNLFRANYNIPPTVS